MKSKIPNSLKQTQRDNPYPWIKEGHMFIIQSALSPHTSNGAPYMELTFGWLPNHKYRVEIFDSKGNLLERRENNDLPNRDRISVQSINQGILESLNIDTHRLRSVKLECEPDDLPCVTLRYLYREGYTYSFFYEKM